MPTLQVITAQISVQSKYSVHRTDGVYANSANSLKIFERLILRQQ